jgi:hypothetical protein
LQQLQQQKQAPKQQDSLPAGWESTIDPKTGRAYFYNSGTGAVQWDRPEDEQQQEEADQEQQEEEEALLAQRQWPSAVGRSNEAKSTQKKAEEEEERRLSLELEDLDRKLSQVAGGATASPRLVCPSSSGQVAEIFLKVAAPHRRLVTSISSTCESSSSACSDAGSTSPSSSGTRGRQPVSDAGRSDAGSSESAATCGSNSWRSGAAGGGKSRSEEKKISEVQGSVEVTSDISAEKVSKPARSQTPPSTRNSLLSSEQTPPRANNLYSSQQTPAKSTRNSSNMVDASSRVDGLVEAQRQMQLDVELWKAAAKKADVEKMLAEEAMKAMTARAKAVAWKEAADAAEQAMKNQAIADGEERSLRKTHIATSVAEMSSPQRPAISASLLRQPSPQRSSNVPVSSSTTPLLSPPSAAAERPRPSTLAEMIRESNGRPGQAGSPLQEPLVELPLQEEEGSALQAFAPPPLGGPEAPPACLVLECPGIDEDLELCTGSYKLLAGESANGYPLWKCTASDHWLFSGPGGQWLVGDAMEKEDAFDCNTGYVASHDEHRGRWPDQMPGSEWQLFDNQREEWKLQPAMRVVKKRAGHL